jgi:hypothetical protein
MRKVKYIFIITLSFFSVNAAEKHAYGINHTKNPVVAYSTWTTTSALGEPKTITTDAKIFQPSKLEKFENLLPSFGIIIKKGSDVTANVPERSYDRSKINFKTGRVLIIEDDPIHKSGLKAHTLSKEEFDKKNKPEESKKKEEEQEKEPK